MLDVYPLSTSSAIWDYLITMFEKKTVTEILYLRNLLGKLQFKAGTSMSSHIESFKGIMNQLCATRDPIPQTPLVTNLLDMVKDPLYDNIVTILSNKDGIDFEHTCISLIEYS